MIVRAAAVVAAVTLLTPSQDPPPERLVPGHARLAPARVADGTDTTWVSWTAGGQTRPGPLQIESIRRVTRDGVAAIEHRIAVRGGRSELEDTTWYDARTLAPLAHRSHGAQRAFVLDYGPGVVRGSMTGGPGAGAIDVALDGPVFDPSSLHAILRALRLEAGARFVVPFFDHEARAARLDTLIVTGEGTVATDQGPVPAWLVTVATPRQRARYQVRKSDGRELRIEVDAGGGTMRMLARGVVAH